MDLLRTYFYLYLGVCVHTHAHMCVHVCMHCA